ncbi:hypothetical protein HCH29_08600 [Enterococcus gilvus]|nr:hypothetical protein [Enterococcus gilvus]
MAQSSIKMAEPFLYLKGLIDRIKKRTIEGLYYLGELSGINDFYRIAIGKDWYTGTKDSRIKAAGFTLLDLIS